LWQLLAFQSIPLIFEGEHCTELIRPDFVQPDADAQFQGRPKVQRAPDELAWL
jgi:hypothetical protein